MSYSHYFIKKVLKLKSEDISYSQSCSNCSYKDKNNKLSQAKFECKVCGHKENADINADKNILVVGQTMLACGVVH